MPIEVVVSFSDGSSEMYYIPNDLLFGNKVFSKDVSLLKAWNWVSSEYSFKVKGTKAITKIEIDPSKRLADHNPSDNLIEIAE